MGNTAANAIQQQLDLPSAAHTSNSAHPHGDSDSDATTTFTYPDHPFNTASKGARRPQSEFHHVDHEIIHTARRKAILKKHRHEITPLFGPEILTFPCVMAIFAFQVYMAWWVADKSWPVWISCCYLISATLNHSTQLISHELSHNLCFYTPWKNKLLAITNNFCTGFPSAILFQRYHLEHHEFLGVDEMDPDLPTWAEGRFFSTPLFKFIWIGLLPIFYSGRPMWVRPKLPTAWQSFNFVICFAFDGLIFYTCGLWGLLYLVVGTLVGLAYHPCAGHLIAEHYEFVNNFETYSYYGSCNVFNFNVGYHNEHHDFPKIPWTRLPLVRKIAPEFYEHLPQHDSYLKIFYNYVFDPEMGPFARVIRDSPKGDGKMTPIPYEWLTGQHEVPPSLVGQQVTDARIQAEIDRDIVAELRERHNASTKASADSQGDAGSSTKQQ